MLRFSRLSVLLLAAAMFGGALAAAQEKPAHIQYPAARVSNQVDDYHGTKVADPYRWLEDTDSAETRAWVEAENKLTFGYLEQIPARALIKDRLTKLWNYERYSAPFKRGTRYFYTHNDGLQNQSVYFWTASLNGGPKMLLDPNTLSADGTVAVNAAAVSDDGRFFAYGLSAAGSDWQELHIRDVETGRDLPDVLKWVKFSTAAWKKDGTGFYYARYDEPKPGSSLRDANYFQKLYYHRLGTAQTEDKLIYERPDNKELGFGPHISDDGRYLIIYVSQGTDRRNRIYYLDLKSNGGVVRLLDDFDASYRFIDNDGPVFYLRSDLEAPRGRVIAIDTRHPERKNWTTIISAAAERLEGVSLVGDRLIARYLKDAHTEVRIFDMKGRLRSTLALPGLGTANGFDGRREDQETFYSYTSFTTPATIYRYEIKSGKSTVFQQPKVDFDPAAFETRQVFYASKDGTRVPMFITAKKGLNLDGTNPTLLYAYGGFDISLTPDFVPANLVWMEMGGVFAQPSLRGGGEYGDAWHQAGMKERKQNVFDDFIAAAEWLIANKYTSPPHLAISGRSNGGLLVGACMTQRPDLFGATLPGVGVMDMLRFHKFTIGWGWTSEYGSADDPALFPAIYRYSPLHNIKPGTQYPPTFIVTADHDDRVVPGHSFKFAATMQADQAGSAPILIRIETRAGHGGGKPITKRIEEVTDEWTFLVQSLRMPANPFAH